MVRHILERNKNIDNANINYPEVGSFETTKSATPYRYRSGLKKIFLYLYVKEIDVYIWDMPGLGGRFSSEKIQ